jgi:hypothetical protein
VERGRRLSWWAGGIAGAGVLVTHWLSYRLAVPHAHHRADVLHDSGHAHWPVLSVVGLALFTVAALRLCAHGWRGRPMPGLRATALRLAALQAVGWTAVEVGERALSGRLATLDDNAVLLLGLGVQLAVAVVAAVLVRLTVRVLSAWAAARAARPRRVVRPVALPAGAGGPRLVLTLAGAGGLRGPPPMLPTP